MTDFDSWNEIKKKVDGKEGIPNKFPQEGEVWMMIFGKNIGYEQNGSGRTFARPGLIVRKFNNQMLWIVPLTRKQKNFDFYFNFIDPDGLSVSAILAQLRMVSTRRLENRLYSMKSEPYLLIKEKLKSYL